MRSTLGQPQPQKQHSLTFSRGHRAKEARGVAASTSTTRWKPFVTVGVKLALRTAGQLTWHENNGAKSAKSAAQRPVMCAGETP